MTKYNYPTRMHEELRKELTSVQDRIAKESKITASQIQAQERLVKEYREMRERINKLEGR